MTASRIKRIPSTTALPAELRGGVVAIGNFDGVHRGHQAVLERALEEARRKNVPALVLTFEPHPRETFRPDLPLFRLTTAAVRARLLDALGFDAVIEQRFDQDFSTCSSSEFVERVLLSELGISHVVTGYDFHFGSGRQGSPEFLVEQGRARHFGVTLVDAFCDEGAGVISSSRIRGLLSEGDVAQSAGLLGYRYTVMAEITHGKKLGRQLGFPTANMSLPASTGLLHGIYAVRLRRQDGSLHDGVASFGLRPTVDSDGAPLLETFVFDFSDSLYGECCSVSFFGYLRGEVKFDGLDPLIVQMKKDEEEARALLSGVRPLSELDFKIAF